MIIAKCSREWDDKTITLGGGKFMKNWFIVFLICTCLYVAQERVSADWNVYFDDMLPSNSHYSNVQYLADEGIIKGYPVEGYDWLYEFKPSANVTRRQAATMLVRALALEGEKAVDPGFVDVTKKDGAYKAIAIATAHGFFEKGTHFKPGAAMTREDMAYALVRAFDLTGQSSTTFSDVPQAHPAYSDIQALAANFITTGNNGKFDPSANMTRAQFASFLTRARLPEARPVETVVTQGLVPKALAQTYVYNLYHTGIHEQYTFDNMEQLDLAEIDNALVMTGSDDPGYILYLENRLELHLESSLFGSAKILVLSYPLTAGAKYSFDEYVDEPHNNINGEIVKHNVTVHTVNGLYKIGEHLFTDVIILEDETNQYGGIRTCYISKQYGLLAIGLGDGLLELDRIE